MVHLGRFLCSWVVKYLSHIVESCLICQGAGEFLRARGRIRLKKAAGMYSSCGDFSMKKSDKRYQWNFSGNPAQLSGWWKLRWLLLLHPEWKG
jgi:hypothetical protein